jgi:uncharacterized protein GlcG (DUF336 family)
MRKGWFLSSVIAFSAGAAIPPAGAASPFHDKPASPQSLPGDNLPPFAMLDAAGKLIPVPDIPASLLHRGPGAPPESSAPGPKLEFAIEAARAAVAACEKSGYRVGVTVIDSAGEARAMLSADGSDGSHVFVAMRKALTALAFNSASSAAHDAVTRDSSLLGRVTPAMFVEGGALPLVAQNVTIGAIGVSGAAGTPIGHQDEVCAQAGIDRIKDRLRAHSSH